MNSYLDYENITMGLRTRDWLITGFVVVALVIPSILNYQYDIYENNSPKDTETGGSGTAGNTLATFVQAWDMAIPFLMVYYAIYIRSSPMMFKNPMRYFNLLLALAAWILVLVRPIGGGDLGRSTGPSNPAWDAVAKYVATPVAAASLFTLPATWL